MWWLLFHRLLLRPPRQRRLARLRGGPRLGLPATGFAAERADAGEVCGDGVHLVFIAFLISFFVPVKITFPLGATTSQTPRWILIIARFDFIYFLERLSDLGAGGLV